MLTLGDISGLVSLTGVHREILIISSSCSFEQSQEIKKTPCGLPPCSDRKRERERERAQQRVYK